MESISVKKVPQSIVWGEETLCFIFKFFPISKSSSLTFEIQTMTFQAKLLATVFKVIQYGFEILQIV